MIPRMIDRATYTLHTDDDPIETEGVEILGTAQPGPFTMTGTYSFTRARERGWPRRRAHAAA